MSELLTKRKLRQREEEAGEESRTEKPGGEEGRGSRRAKVREREKKSESVTASQIKDNSSNEVVNMETNEIKETDFEIHQDFAALKEKLIQTNVSSSNPSTSCSSSDVSTNCSSSNVSVNKLETKVEIEAMEVDEKADIETKPQEKWENAEKILCFHGPLIYEAKIQEVVVQNTIPKYFIHYKGWNKNWDEWVPEARMLKHTPQNVEIQKDLCRAHEAKEQSKKRKEHVFAVPKTPSPVPRKDKGRRKAGLKPKRREESGGDAFLLQNGKQVSLKAPDNTVETEDQFRTKMEIKIKMPEELKSYIVDDWAQVCKKKRLCVLPARTTADQLISEYTRAKTANKADKLKNNKERAILEVWTILVFFLSFSSR